MGNSNSSYQDDDGVPPQSSIHSSSEGSSSLASASTTQGDTNRREQLSLELQQSQPQGEVEDDSIEDYTTIESAIIDDDEDDTETTECYPFPLRFLWRKKTDPWTIVDGTEQISAQSTTTTIQPPPTVRRSVSLPVLEKMSFTPSFSECVKYSSCSAYGDEEDAETAEESLTKSSSFSNFGCVTSPLASYSRSSSWSNLMDDEMLYTDEELIMIDGEEPTEESNMVPSTEHGPREFWIVTTAALPWMTGTAVNPLLRSAYLSQRNRPFANGKTTVTLVLPWLEAAEDRIALYGEDWKDATPDDQNKYIRDWLCHSANLPLEADVSKGGIEIHFYPARYHAGLSSIFAMGDLCQLIPEETSKKMICVLEEPEHVNFYRAPGRESWREKFDHVVGIIHTNYKAYAASHYSGLVTGPLVGAMSSLMVRAYCDKVVKLSDVLQSYAPEKEVVSNVHGIRSEFFSKECTGDRVYFIGKLLWAKGLDKMIDLQASYRKATGKYFEMDIFGSGPEQSEIERAFLHPYYGAQTEKRTSRLPPMSFREWRREAIPARFLGRKDHAAVGHEYKIFVNPSITEVLCTTTAEATAMGKWVIVPSHPSNEFFTQFPNCMLYNSKQEFTKMLQHALANDPPTMTEETQYPLTWEAATDRFLESACTTKRDARRRDRIGKNKLDERIAKLHYTLGTGVKGDVIRKVLGGGPVADQYQYEKGSSPLRASRLETKLMAEVAV